MTTFLKTTCLSFLLMAAGSTLAATPPDTDADRAHPGTFVKDSIITTKIKTKLAAEHITSMGRIKVDTDNKGVVWLKGTARTQATIDKAVAIAEATEGVTAVHSKLKVRADD